MVAIGEEGETTLTGIVRCCWSLTMMVIMTMIINNGHDDGADGIVRCCCC